ncbi:MAG: hypothetical protein ABJA64_01280 [Candidatus Saccharibacteria bacterium]
MSFKSSQNGSMHIVIIITLVIAVIALLGFVFWKNFFNKDTANDKKVESSKLASSEQKDPNADLTETLVSELFGRTISLKYPKDWTKTESELGDINNSFTRSITLTGPSKKVEVALRLMSGGGLGGSCQDEDSTIISVNREAFKTDKDLVYIESIIHQKYNLYGDLQDSGKITQTVDTYSYDANVTTHHDTSDNAKVGDTGCALFAARFPYTKGDQPASQNVPILNVGIKFSALDNRDDVAQQEVAQSFALPDYKTAKRILLTLTDK